MDPVADRVQSRVAVRTFAVVVTVYLGWIDAWLAKELLDDYVAWLQTPAGGFAYWTTMKLLLWVGPALWLIHISGREIRDVFNLARLRHAIFWGAAVGLLLASLSLATKAIQHRHLLPVSMSWAFIGAVVIAPVFEEFLFRGAVLGALTQRYRFAVANLITAALFLGIHLPGWYFQGRLWQNLCSPASGALAILVLGLIFGFVARKGKSLLASILAHAINNLFSL